MAIFKINYWVIKREKEEREKVVRIIEQVRTGLSLKSHLVPTRMNGAFGQ